MRTIERANIFKRDFRHVKAMPRYSKKLETLLSTVLEFLVTDQPLPSNYRDHSLSGDWDGYRECHLKPDLLLIYKLPDKDTLYLARLGSHSELFG